MVDPFERVPLRSTGVSITRLGFGAAPLGSLFSEVSDADAAATLSAAFQAGIKYVDTAPLYGYGLSEERVGLAIAEASFTISTKVGRLPRRGATADLTQMVGGAPIWADDRGLGIIRDYSRSGVESSLAESGQRLGVSRIDIALVHDPEDVVDQVIAETIPALAELRDAGVVGAVGIGSGRPDVIARILRGADVDVVMCAAGLALGDPAPPDELLAMCATLGIPVIAAGVFRSGLYADPRPGARMDYGPADDADLDFARTLREICLQYGVSLKAAALQHPFHLPAVAGIVVGMRTPAEVDAAVRAVREPVPAEAWTALREFTALRAAS